MKVYIAVFVMLAALSAGYYVFKNNKGPVAGLSYEEFTKRIRSIGEFKNKTLKTAADIGSSLENGAEKFEAVMDFLEQAPAKVSSTIEDLKNKMPDGALDFLADPRKATGQKLAGFIAINSGAAIPTKDLRGNVCAQFARDSKVEYSLTNPFSPASDYEYSLEWGDGGMATGSVVSDDKPLFVEHIYAKSGVFKNVFNVTGATSTLSAEITICVN
jgi:hypothetical protein